MALPDDSAPSPEDVIVLAKSAGFAIDRSVAQRITTSIGPALRGLDGVVGTLPFDLEPTTFVRVQSGAKP